jgi:4-hydroxy-tetrahydrodipicolinate reductase
MRGKIKYGIVGYKGRLGTEVFSVFSEVGNEMVYKFDLDGESISDVPSVLIDCSLPDVFEKSISVVEEYKIPFIIATTGLLPHHFEKLKEIAKQVPVVQSYNYSIGIQVLLKLVEIASDKLNDWDVEIEETHHRFKKDKPSGTAKMIEKIFGEKKINISSLRLGNVAGDHEVKFGGLGEVLSIKHSATSRRTFAEGILKSAEFVLTKEKGLYSFTDVIFPN